MSKEQATGQGERRGFRFSEDVENSAAWGMTKTSVLFTCNPQLNNLYFASMKATDTLPEPYLDAPGAGLPPVELFFANLLFSWMKLTRSREKLTLLFQGENKRVLELVRGCGEEMGSRRVLIKRLPGMEDSSRYWSVWMTLEHLRMVNQGIANTIRDLGNGMAREGKASTAAVKPRPEADASSLEKFDHSCELVLNRAAQIRNLNTRARYAHPWFGPLNAHGWYAIAPFHLKLHRTQIEHILAASTGS